jgi:hypothetical protein
MKLFQFAILWHPTEQQRKDGQLDKILVDVGSFLQKDQNTALLAIARLIPEEYANQLEQVEIVIRPF